MPEMTIKPAWPSFFTPLQAWLLSDIQSAPIDLRPRQQIPSRKTTGDGFPADSWASIVWTEWAGGIPEPEPAGQLFRSLRSCWATRPASRIASGAATVKETTYERFQALDIELVEISKQFRRISMIETSISRYWIFRIGWLVGRARIANFLSEMLVGLYAAGLVQHGELRRASGPVMKLPELFQAGQHRWDYLYLGADLDREIRGKYHLVRCGDAPRPERGWVGQKTSDVLRKRGTSTAANF